MRYARRAAAVALLLGALAALSHSCRQVPRFAYDFEQDVELDRLEWRCLTQFRLSSAHVTSGTKSLEVSFHPALDVEEENYPGLSFSRFDRDWTGYRSLSFDVFNPEGATMSLALRIDDREAPDYADRCNRHLEIPPGANSVEIPFTELLSSGTQRPLDLGGIRSVMLFLPNPREQHTLYFDHVRLQ